VKYYNNFFVTPKNINNITALSGKKMGTQVAEFSQ